MRDPSRPRGIAELVASRARLEPDAPALLAPDRAPLSYAALAGHLEDVGATLASHGIGRSDRVALLLGDGAEAATAFMSVASHAVCAPLNPMYGDQELDFYFSDLGAKAVIALAGDTRRALDTARTRGIAVLELRPRLDAPAGLFALSPGARVGAAGSGDDDLALVLHTSGTTARPKRVPLKHGNLCASARGVAATLGLTPADRCLNVMPLFHIHGLVAGVLASLAAGASVVCVPGFQASRFFEWLDDFRPTWYTAVPTMHQAILSRAAEQRGGIPKGRLRFIRSSSAPLPPQVMSDLEAAFGVPVIEAYGMTEAAHQVASNPLPPRRRKPGSVGLAAGPEVAIMDETGRLLEADAVGEVVLRGPSLTSGYEDNPEANAKAFADGWFRTGDLGTLDRDGYLFLRGRLKELINRAGEKIAPREVEESLLEHTAVAQAVAFAVPDRLLGEDVGAAVVLRAGHTAAPSELKAFVAARLAHFKLPRHLVCVDEIPKGPTGKLQRAGLAERLGLPRGGDDAEHDRTAPRTPLEERLVELWARVLRREVSGVHVPFLDMGGDSLTGVQLLARVHAELGVELSLAQLFEAPSVAGMAGLLEALREPGRR